MASNKLIDSFRLFEEKEKADVVIESIEKGVPFKGTNLWILIFAIFIASLGLNVNSTAVIIGAMLISPIMGPIMGLGLGLGINDLSLFRKSFRNYLFAVLVGLTTSTFYFLLSPINEAHSEILARTQPNIYDVLIAFFGGLAGVLAVSSKQKGNVIPGVAIATALMPPLCTAGYGLATLQWNYFGGAFYLFIINTVFIALATLIAVRYLHFPVKHQLDPKKENRSKHIAWLITVLTIGPSIYFGYAFIEDNRFTEKANRFIEKETKLQDEYLLNKKIDAASRKITLTYGGAKLKEELLMLLRGKFQSYEFSKKATLEIKQGFSYLEQKEKDEMSTAVLSDKDLIILKLQSQLDSATKYDRFGAVIYRELKINYPTINTVSLSNPVFNSDSLSRIYPVCIISTKQKLTISEQYKIRQWLKLRLSVDSVDVIVR